MYFYLSGSSISLNHYHGPSVCYCTSSQIPLSPVLLLVWICEHLSAISGQGLATYLEPRGSVSTAKLHNEVAEECSPVQTQHHLRVCSNIFNWHRCFLSKHVSQLFNYLKKTTNLNLIYYSLDQSSNAPLWHKFNLLVVFNCGTYAWIN